MKHLLVLAALLALTVGCSDEEGCKTPGAVRINGACNCPKGYKLDKSDGEECVSTATAAGASTADSGGSPDGGSVSAQLPFTTDAAAPSALVDSGGVPVPNTLSGPASFGSDAAASSPGSGLDGGSAEPTTPSPQDPITSSKDAAAAEPSEAAVQPCVVTTEACDGKDNDCDGAIDEDSVCRPAPVYTCPPGACAEWPMPDSIAGAKVAPKYTVGTEAVTDEVTKLVWQRHMPARPVPGCARTGGSCSHDEATAYCDQLTLAGASDWRLPSKIELESLQDDSLRSGVGVNYRLDASFTTTPGSYRVWTSSPIAADPQSHWAVDFVDGFSLTTTSTSGEGVMPRCVRGGRRASGSRYTIEAASVTDLWTGLQWQREANATPLMWQAAGSYCSTVGQGFRLPTKKELLTLIDVSRSGIPIDPDVFPDVFRANDNLAYWSSTLTLNSGYGGTVASVVVPAGGSDTQVNYGGSFVRTIDKSEDVGKVRCVR